MKNEIKELEKLGYVVVLADNICVRACVRDAVLDVDKTGISWFSISKRKMNNLERKIARKLLHTYRFA